MISSLFVLSSALGALGASIPLKRHENLANVPRGWSFHGPANEKSPLQLYISVASEPAAVRKFERALTEISDPAHENYGNHFERDELSSLLRPRHSSTTKIVKWLRDAGIPQEQIAEDGQIISFATDVKTAQEMLGTEFGSYKFENDDKLHIRTTGYSVPHSISESISMIQPTTRFGSPKPLHSEIFTTKLTTEKITDKGPKSCKFNLMTPKCFQDLYNIHYAPSANSSGKVAFASFLKEYARYDDIASFAKKYAPYAMHDNMTVELVNGGLNKQDDAEDDSGEANLDAQTIVGLTSPMPLTEYSTGGNGPLIPTKDEPTQADNANEPYLPWLQYLLNLDNKDLPHTLSISYGEDEYSLPQPYMREVCGLFAQLGARGVTVLVASGDAGPGSSCTDYDGKTVMEPNFPASCPYVTTVGGTYHFGPERAVDFSGGGFSVTFDRPEWQEHAVSKYVKSLGNKFEGLYNASGRAYPDLAAQSVNFAIFDKGSVQPIAGTSASTPLVASVVALLNAARLSQGKKVFGFINPFIYKHQHEAFTDIVDGGSKGCTGTSIYSQQKAGKIPYASWNATAGWDAVTGVGTPIFDKLLAIAAPGVANKGR